MASQNALVGGEEVESGLCHYEYEGIGLKSIEPKGRRCQRLETEESREICLYCPLFDFAFYGEFWAYWHKGFLGKLVVIWLL